MKMPTVLLAAALAPLAAACAPAAWRSAPRPAVLASEVITFGTSAPFGGAAHASSLAERLRHVAGGRLSWTRPVRVLHIVLGKAAAARLRPGAYVHSAARVWAGLTWNLTLLVVGNRCERKQGAGGCRDEPRIRPRFL
ncbi:hypothetical protein PHLGIDRAFT_16460 [Phlebiopsis gigantea 11061_1 CR5-6]|uniref:Lipoprotein n=1 Tax=Phlebiopsis gigantea (strain 11061_1 CR5-6) TaxID=745531 RepID=A0A0C3NDD7_PHLG1|nr:hypothetical protein PHLGIDRAFT_16460 [Phlebiopsis gigantea 11061_1 CR5-6]